MSDTKEVPSLVKNTLFNIVDTGVRLSLALVLSPILLWSLGTEIYGLWSVIWAFSGSLGVIDLRVNSALTPLIATAHKAGNSARMIKLVNNGLLFYSALGVVVFAAVYWMMQIPALQGLIPERVRGETGFAVPAAVAVFTFSTLRAMWASTLYGLQRYDITAKINMWMGVLRVLVLLAVALLGGGIKELVLVEVGVAVLFFFILGGAVVRNIPGFYFSIIPEKKILTELFSFGSKLQVGYIAHLVVLHFDKLIISVVLGLSAVAFYDLGAKIVGIARMLPVLLVSATMPVASVLQAAGKKEELWIFFKKGTCLLAWVGMPIFLWASIGAGPLLYAWSGVNALESQITLCLLSIGFFVNVYSEMGYMVIVGIGRPGVEMKRSLASGVMNVILSATLIKVIGFAGAPLGTSLALTIGAVILFSDLLRHFDKPFGEIIKPLFGPIISAIPAGALAYGILMFVPPGSRFASLPYLFSSAAGIGLIYLSVGWAAGVFRKEHLLALKQAAKKDV